MKNRVTIKDLANECGVSIATISRVLNKIPGCCNAEMEARILDTVKSMGYHPNLVARSLVTRKANFIAALIPDIHNYYFQDFYTGLESIFNENGYRVLLCNTQGSKEKEAHFLNELQMSVDGFVVSTLNDDEDNTKIKKLHEDKIPIVTLERYGEKLDDVYKIQVDNILSTKLAVDYLYKNGHKRIAFIKGPDTAINGELRFRGYITALKSHGIDVDYNLVKSGDFKFEAGLSTAEKLLEQGDFTAVIAANDLMAVGACRAFRMAGKKVPDDISVIGMDGTMISETYHPVLSTIVFHGYEMGVCTAQYLMKIIEGEAPSNKQVVFTPELRCGESIRNIAVKI